MAFARLRKAHEQKPGQQERVIQTAKVLSLGYGAIKRRFSSYKDHRGAECTYQEPNEPEKHQGSVSYVNPLSRKEESFSPQQRELSNWILNVTKDGYYYFYDTHSGQHYRETLPEDWSE